MELLKCKACGCHSMVPVELAAEEADEMLVSDKESRFFTCHVCGDNWLSVKATEADGTCEITFVHQMGMQPVLKRVASLQTHIVVKEDTVNEWRYFFGDDEVEEDRWRARLGKRRQILKQICTN